ncbi:MAG: HD domain-containing protein [bacterium]|nr:HD domain-containing protein [bacterium]
MKRKKIVENEYLEKQVHKLNKIGIALTSEQNLDKLLEMIVWEARNLVNCDAGSLYIKKDDLLDFVVSQNDTMTKRLGEAKIKELFKTFSLPITKESVSGYTALTGEILNIPDVYEISKNSEYKINLDYDRRNQYRSRSMLVVPLKDNENKVIGVIQLINALDKAGNIIPFSGAMAEELICSLGSQAAVAIKNAQLTKDLKAAYLDTIYCLSEAAESKDKDTGMHIQRVSNYSVALGKKLGLAERELELILYASPMHDIGKVGIPDAVLLKPGKLDVEERKIIEQHTVIGGNILSKAKGPFSKISKEIALTHHEKFDGTGYPNKLIGEEIPLSGRIVALADVFDALINKRCYKSAMSCDDVIEIIKKESGKHFDPKIVTAFFDSYKEIIEIFEKNKDTPLENSTKI